MDELKISVLTAKSTRQAWIISIIVIVFAMAASNALMFVLYPFDLAYSLILTTPLIAFLISTPPAIYFSKLMLKNYRLTIMLKEMVERDRLTNVATRDHFFARMEAEPRLHGVSLMVDVDHFKRVNDTYGHLAGDAAIRMVADILRAEVREQDIVCRFGGEEFLIFLRGADAKFGWQIAERMRGRVAATKLPLQQAELSLTVSIGGALKLGEGALEPSIKAADEALYRAKSAGRNRTEFVPRQVLAA